MSAIFCTSPVLGIRELGEIDDPFEFLKGRPTTISMANQLRGAEAENKRKTDHEFERRSQEQEKKTKEKVKKLKEEHE